MTTQDHNLDLRAVGRALRLPVNQMTRTAQNAGPWMGPNSETCPTCGQPRKRTAQNAGPWVGAKNEKTCPTCGKPWSGRKAQFGGDDDKAKGEDMPVDDKGFTELDEAPPMDDAPLDGGEGLPPEAGAPAGDDGVQAKLDELASAIEDVQDDEVKERLLGVVADLTALVCPAGACEDGGPNDLDGAPAESDLDDLDDLGGGDEPELKENAMPEFGSAGAGADDRLGKL